jgi:hypothetical protein
LPTNLPASIFIVQHMASENTGGALLHRLSRHRAFGCKLAKDGESFKPGRIYIAPPDNHLLAKKDKVLVTKGARENRSRPGIDPLFQSAAVTHTSRVIGVLLTGMLDDGTAGPPSRSAAALQLFRTRRTLLIPACRRARSIISRSTTVCRSVKWGLCSKHLPKNVQAKANQSRETSELRQRSRKEC